MFGFYKLSNFSKNNISIVDDGLLGGVQVEDI